MEYRFGKLAILGAALSVVSLAGCGGAPSVEEEDTPEAAAYHYRDSVMHVLENKMGTIGDMAREEIPLDEAVFAKAVNDLVALSGMVLEGFTVEGVPAGSRALPEIWDNWDDFQQKVADLQSTANELAAAVAEGGFAAAQTAAQTAGRNGCGGCHRIYRAREE